MARIFSLPELAESVVEGEITQWLIAEGEQVELDQPLLEVMTDKVTVEIPSPFGGVLLKRLVAEGDIVPVGTPLAHFADDGASGEEPREQVPEGESDQESQPAPKGSDDGGDALSLFKASGSVDDGPLPTVRKPSARAGQAVGPTQAAPPELERSPRPSGPWGRPLAVPAARKRARELGVPIEQVLGSGPHGRIRLGDVEAYGEGARTSAVPLGRYRPTALAPEPDGPESENVPLRGMRRTIAKQLLEGHLTTVQTLAVEEADASQLVALRTRLKPRAAERGVKLSYLPFILKALTRSLMVHPVMNARMDEKAGAIVRFRDVHLGVAVDTDQGLIVPVVRNASRRSLLDLGAEVARLAAAARSGQLSTDDIRGGTFSVTNIGSVGALLSMPILNAPEAGILGVHRIKMRPVVLDDDSIVARPMLYLSLTFDHRLVDGAEATRFLGHLVGQVERPEAMLLGEEGLADSLLDA